jgi:hypothetical protein
MGTPDPDEPRSLAAKVDLNLQKTEPPQPFLQMILHVVVTRVVAGFLGNPRLYDHPDPRPQLELWSSEAVEWFVIIQAAPYGSRPRSKRTARIFVAQPPLLTEGTQG